MNRTVFAGAVALATLAMAAPAAAAPTVETFDDPVTLSPTQAPNAWYVDRKAPAGFESGVSFGGDNRLRQTIAAADATPGDPGFYNTQGRKFDLAADTNFLSIDLFVDDAWATTGNRIAGLWGTGFGPDGPDAGTAPDVTAYPIIEFTSTGGAGHFRVWDSTAPGSWTDLGLPGGFAYDDWYTLEIRLANDKFTYTIGDLSYAVDALGTTGIGNVILQGHNTAKGVDNTIYWDNLRTGAVPEPSAWAVMILGFGLAGTAMRRRRAAIA